MPLTTQNVTGNVTLLYGSQGSNTGVSMMIINTDAANTIYVSDSSTVTYGGTNGVPLGPGAQLGFSGSVSLYAVSAGPTVAVAMVPNGTSYFLPASLNNLGGARVYVQAGKPTGNIPANSIWFNTSNSSLETYTDGDWESQTFDAALLLQAATILGSQIASETITAANVASQTLTAAQIADGTLTTTQIAAAAGILGTQIANATIQGSNIAANTIEASNIAANTITAAQLAAGIVYAGIINGTTVNAATFTGSTFEGTDFDIDTTGAFFYFPSDTTKLFAALAASSGTDPNSNAYPAGLTVNGSSSGQINANVNSVGQPWITFATQASIENPDALASIWATTFGSGTAERIQLALNGAISTSQSTGWPSIFLESAASEDTSPTGYGILGYTLNNDSVVTAIQWSNTGINLDLPVTNTLSFLANATGLTNPNIYGYTTGTGTANYCYMKIDSGTQDSSATGNNSSIVLWGGSGDGTTSVSHLTIYAGPTNAQVADFNKNGVNITGAISATTGTAANPTVISTDSWNTMAAFTSGSYSHGSPSPAYKLMPDNTVAFAGIVDVSSSASTNEIVGAFGSTQYYPETAKRFICATTASDLYAEIIVNTTGELQLASYANYTGASVYLDGIRYPLDY